MVAVVALGVFAVASGEERPAPKGAKVERLASAETNRFAYWEVALNSFAGAPLGGVGSGGFRIEWLREREIPEAVIDAHSLYIETAAELGLLGLAALAVFLAGLVACARRVLRADAALAAGPVAVFSVWAVACALDWDWEFPAVTLFGLMAAACLIARSDSVTAAAPELLPPPEPGVGGHRRQHHHGYLGRVAEARQPEAGGA